jgi:tetratricopeptide (TPR) repeat protein
MPKPSREDQLAEFKDRLATAKDHRSADRMELARAEYTQALAFAEEHFGPESTQVDTVCLELALFYSTMKEPEAELAVLERRVRVRKAEAGISQIVDALQDVAECHKLQDRPDVAESTYREALKLCDESIEAHHPALAHRPWQRRQPRLTRWRARDVRQAGFNRQDIPRSSGPLS